MNSNIENQYPRLLLKSAVIEATTKVECSKSQGKIKTKNKDKDLTNILINLINNRETKAQDRF